MVPRVAGNKRNDSRIPILSASAFPFLNLHFFFKFGTMAQNMVFENVWLDKGKYDDAERIYYEGKAKPVSDNKNECQLNSIVLLEEKVQRLEKTVANMQQAFNSIVEHLHKLEARVSGKAQPVSTKKETKNEDDDVDLFGSESEDEAASEIKQKRLAEYESRKSKKPALIAKSNIILDVKPWDDETDMKVMEKEVRAIQIEGLLWGASKLVPLAYGIHKLQISCVVEDDLVSVDLLQEKIEDIEDYVQSVDIAAFNKV
ncbi:elongation factor 1-beta-like isoform X2 [Photinus pyralis]|nr:elongation factor 1-beta-like isoform X2 [Photinus pyralis]